jgi:outer membrane protein assembly factor BamC
MRAFRLAAIALLLSGCAATEGLGDLSRIEYRSATKAAPLDIPPDLVSPRRDERFALPGGAADGGAPTTYSAYSRERTAERASPSGASSVMPNVVGTRIEREGDQRWLVVDLPPEKVWPVVRAFWLDSGFVLSTDSPETGILETDWAESRPPVPDSALRARLAKALGSLYTTGERDRFRTRLERSGGSTEIYVSHRGMVEELTGREKDSTMWVQRRGDTELEAEFLRRLRLRFAGPAQVAAAGGAAASVQAPAAPRAALVQGDAGPQLRLAEDFDRAWRRVGLALDRSGFTVEDRDRSQGTYFVRYVDPQVEARAGGVLARVFGGGDRDLSGRRYRIVVIAEAPGQGGAAQSSVRVLDERGAAPAVDADRRAVGQIAALLQEQLR